MPPNVGRAHYLKRQAEAREAQDERIRRQVESGTLVIRQMTPEEREKWGPPKNLTKPKGARRKSLSTPHAGDLPLDAEESTD